MCQLNVCVFAVSCLVLGTSALYRADIRLLPGRGSQLIDDINAINTLLEEHAQTLNVLHARKTFGNDLVILVFESEPGPNWISAHAAFTARGFHVTVTPIKQCADLAQQFDVSLVYPPVETIEQYEFNDMYEVEFYDKGMSTTAYNETLKTHFQKHKILKEEGISKSACYFQHGALPVRLLYFAHVDAREETEIIHVTNLATKASITRRRVASLAGYKALKCSSCTCD